MLNPYTVARWGMYPVEKIPQFFTLTLAFHSSYKPVPLLLFREQGLHWESVRQVQQGILSHNIDAGSILAVAYVFELCIFILCFEFMLHNENKDLFLDEYINYFPILREYSLCFLISLRPGFSKQLPATGGSRP